MITNDFITQLKAQCPALKNRVYGSVELSSATPNSMQMPCAFVVPMTEKGERNTLINGYSQRITVQIGVVICVENFSNDKGESGHVELESVRNEIRAALCNFETANTAVPTEFVTGQIAAYDGMHLRWNDVFTTQFYYRK